MLGKGLINPNMEILTKTPDLRLSKYIDKITNLAKNKYKVNMGPLFSIKYGLRKIIPGEKPIGNTTLTTKIVLIPNEEAFIAIDKSKQKQIQDAENELNRQRYKVLKDQLKEIENIQKEGNYEIDEEGNVVPLNLPKINIKC